jgi:hypothetical protein
LDILKFRKKPVVIEAVKWTGDADSWNTVIAFAGDKVVGQYEFGHEGDPNFMEVSILTTEGRMIASLDDWIIKGVEGEFYPCKPSVFEATYEAVE